MEGALQRTKFALGRQRFCTGHFIPLFWLLLCMTVGGLPAPARADAVDAYVAKHLETDHIPGLSLVSVPLKPCAGL